MVEMQEEVENELPEEDYYQLLHVARTASAEEINSAYHRFSHLFHPDKHNNAPNRKKWAETIFNKKKEAYEVLSDSRKRDIYDSLGKKGLEVDGWEVALRTHTPGEIRKEYESGDSAIIPHIEVSGMTTAQSVEAPVSFRNTFTLIWRCVYTKWRRSSNT